MLAQQGSVADTPYTTPDEDPFNVRPYVQEVKTIKHKRSSMLDKWISEQQAQPSDCSSADALPTPTAYFSSPSLFASSSNPYLAYPDLPRVSSEAARSKDEDTESIISYDLVNDDDIPDDTTPRDPLQQVPGTPTAPRTHKSSRNSITPSFRNLNLTFRSNSPSSPSSPNMEATSRAMTRLSFFPRTPRSSTGPSSSDVITPQQHTRSSSLSTLALSASHPPTKIHPSSTSSKWRPSVLGHFHQSSASQLSVGTSEAQYTPSHARSRPSISSGETYTSWNTSRTTTTVDSNIPPTPSKLSLFDSIRLRGNKSPTTLSRISVASTSSVRLSSPQTGGIIQDGSSVVTDHMKSSQRIVFAPKTGSMLDNVDDEDDLDPPPTYRFNKHESIRSPIPASGTLPRVKFSSLNSRTHRKKKKLIISGVGVTEVRKFEGIKRWCESFGDVRQITRMPNGDLQIDFRDPEVADTVCRVRAKVTIAGVGSVQLSWIAGNKR
ncbi:hypothetical protein GALMADRAFT_359499 [Galerina marginata CBS 339.88]|uniref:RRM domain-containing protein n=1 Tax=Galerina marginata (strain CBS 339.88) TaxID=685588 RepID=A0A067TQE5_GALM3|nr:hypothetical protein GALMADRAFT_359499 [Galerina marginata CBS 339.88]